MKQLMKISKPLAQITLALVAVTTTNLATPAVAQPGTTRIAKWHDDKKAAFLLMFDDGWPSHFQVALPELLKRKLTATFYIVPSKGEYKKFEKTWREQFLQQGMALANHTMTHDGLQSPEDAEREFTDCTKYINELMDEVGKTKAPRLISYGKPGVKDWNITREQEKELIAKNNLVERPDFAGHGAVYHWKTVEEMLALADKAIAKGGMEYLVIHGVERIEPNWGYQDFWALKQDIFLPLLDGLVARRDKGELWITDHVSQHQYETERDSGAVKTIESSAQKIKLEFKPAAAPQFYDLPLTLITQVPDAWKKCRITQGETKSEVIVANSAVMFEARPNSASIEITPVG
jgi:peptidoglycan/xylan/chitin deacetylase (PgdA/CDA1 family)